MYTEKDYKQKVKGE